MCDRSSADSAWIFLPLFLYDVFLFFKNIVINITFINMHKGSLKKKIMLKFNMQVCSFCDSLIKIQNKMLKIKKEIL